MALPLTSGGGIYPEGMTLGDLDDVKEMLHPFWHKLVH
jgi:hypothetical protein